MPTRRSAAAGMPHRLTVRRDGAIVARNVRCKALDVSDALEPYEGDSGGRTIHNTLIRMRLPIGTDVRSNDTVTWTDRRGRQLFQHVASGTVTAIKQGARVLIIETKA